VAGGKPVRIYIYTFTIARKFLYIRYVTFQTNHVAIIQSGTNGHLLTANRKYGTRHGFNRFNIVNYCAWVVVTPYGAFFAYTINIRSEIVLCCNIHTSAYKTVVPSKKKCKNKDF